MLASKQDCYDIVAVLPKSELREKQYLTSVLAYSLEAGKVNPIHTEREITQGQEYQKWESWRPS